MKNDPVDLLTWCLERGLVSAEEVVTNAFVAVERRSRNLSLSVRRRDGSPGIFIKHVDPAAPNAEATMALEAAVMAAGERTEGWADLVPRLRFFEPTRSLLAIEFLEGYRNANELLAGEGRVPEDVARALGGALACLHRLPQEAFRADLATLVPVVPYPLTAHRPEERTWLAGSSGAYLAAVIDGSPAFAQTLEALRAAWPERATTLIHGDVKFDNVLVGDGPVARLIDWEIAGFGDPLWDVAGIFQSFLLTWVFSIPFDPNLPVETSIAQARFPWESLAPSVVALWDAYDADGSHGLDGLERAVQYAGARLVQSSYEVLFPTGQPSPQLVLLLQLASNILTDGRKAMADLLQR